MRAGLTVLISSMLNNLLCQQSANVCKRDFATLDLFEQSHVPDLTNIKNMALSKG